MERVQKEYKTHFSSRAFSASVVMALLLLLASLVVNYIAGTFAAERASNSVTDIILDNVPVVDVDGMFIYGSILFWIAIGVLLALNPKKIPFTVKSIALFVLIRSLFITLTHIGPFPDQAPLIGDFIKKFTFGGDLFFSGHTGLPFLLALLFWNDRILRFVFLATSIVFAVVVLLGHYHYSIDVFAAFFITYAIADLAKLLFKKDRTVFDGTIPITKISPVT